MFARVILLAALLPWISGPVPAASPPARIAVLSIALNDLANQPAAPELPDRLRLLAQAIREHLGTECGYDLVAVDPKAEASAEIAPGYLYQHPDLAVGLVAPVRADWVVIPRLNRASPWVTDLQAQVVRVRDTALVSNRIVELKGIELTPELGTKLAERGGAWMADQVSQAIEHAAGGATAEARRCSPKAS